MEFSCDLCSVKVHDEATLEQHLNGKRHQRACNLKNEHHNRAGRSIFVKGFNKTLDQSYIERYFLKFGPIVETFLEKQKGVYAIIKYYTTESAIAALSQSHHVIQQQQVVVQQKESRDFVLQGPRTKKDKDNQEVQKKTEWQEPVGPDLVAELNSCLDVKTQFHHLVNILELSEEDLKNRHYLTVSLGHGLSTMLSDCKVHVQQFGSSANGLGVKGCDFDLFLRLNPRDEDGTSLVCGEGSLYVKEWHSGNGPVDPEELTKATTQQQIILISRMLKSISKQFGLVEIIPIPEARCPIVKFFYKEHALKCDLSINNRFALRNTRWLELLLKNDPRLRPLFFAIRQWARHREVGGGVRSGAHVSSYSLTLMVIFYLQNTTPPVLPSVERMAELAEKHVEIDGWNCSFCEDVTHLPTSTNTSSLWTLFSDFFSFYVNGQLDGSAVCPRTGSWMPVVELHKLVISDPQYSKFRVAPLCVQDPFLLEHNTTCNVTDRLKRQLLREIKRAASKCEYTFKTSSEKMLYSNTEDLSSGMFSLSNLKEEGDTDSSAPQAPKLTAITPQTSPIITPDVNNETEDKSKMIIEANNAGTSDSTSSIDISSTSVAISLGSDLANVMCSLGSLDKNDEISVPISHISESTANVTISSETHWGLGYVLSTYEDSRHLDTMQDPEDIANLKLLNYTFPLGMTPSRLTSGFLLRYPLSVVQQMEWRKQTVELIINTLSKVLKFECIPSQTSCSSSQLSQTSENPQELLYKSLGIKVEQLAPQPKEGEVKMNQLSPQPKEGEVKMDQLSPQPKEGEVKMDKLSPQPKEGEVKMDQLSPQPKEGEVKMDQLSPQPKEGEVKMEQLSPQEKEDEVRMEDEFKSDSARLDPKGATLMAGDFSDLKLKEMAGSHAEELAISSEGQGKRRRSGENIQQVEFKKMRSDESGNDSEPVSSEFKPHLPTEKPMVESESDTFISDLSTLLFHCSTKQRQWYNRKRTAKEMAGGAVYSFQFEESVSQVQEERSPPQDVPLLDFELCITQSPGGVFNSLTLKFTPLGIGAKEFSCFFSFFQSFINKVVDKCLPAYQ